MAKFKPLPALEVLRERFEYDPESGVLKYKKTGKEAGTLNEGYKVVSIKDKMYKVHRLIWLLYYNIDPGSTLIDHVDGDPTNNKISNLRLATQKQNCHNRKVRQTSMFKGVQVEKGKYRARICVNNTLLHLGFFNTAEEAHAAYMSKARELFGEFACDAKRARSGA